MANELPEWVLKMTNPEDWFVKDPLCDLFTGASMEAEKAADMYWPSRLTNNTDPTDATIQTIQDLVRWRHLGLITDAQFIEQVEIAAGAGIRLF